TQTAVFAGAFYDGTSIDATTFNLVVAPAAGVTLAEAEAALDKVLADFMSEGVDAAQLARIKTQVHAAEIYGRDDVGDRARLYGEALTTGLGIDDIDAWPAALQAVSADDILSAAREVLDRRRAVTGWMQPDTTAEAME